MAQISINIGRSLLNQCRRPAGWLGRLTLWNMNRRHSRVTDWGLTHVSVRPNDTLLDVGCGGGRTLAKLAAIATGGRIYGVDYSDESVAASKRTNRTAIDAGRMEVLSGSVSKLPFPDDMFDVVTAVETHYYWPDLTGDLREILRVIKPGGTVVIVAEAYKGGKYDRVLQRLEQLQRRGIMNYAHLTVREHSDALSNAGYSGVEVFEDYDKGWLCAVGKKPA